MLEVLELLVMTMSSSSMMALEQWVVLVEIVSWV